MKSYLKKIKDKFFYFIVEKNPYILQEYQIYRWNNENIHKKFRPISWIILIGLNIKYRIFRVKLKDIGTLHRKTNKEFSTDKEFLIPKRENPEFFAKRLLKYDVISFDIFDTLILRPFSEPRDLFMLVGNKLNCFDFFKIRVNAEKEARELAKVTKGTHEVTIQDIYSIIERHTGIKKEDGIKAEFETELDMCFANPYMMRVFKILKGQGKSMIATSDMYLSNDMIKKLLDKCKYKGFEKIYVSCDYNCSKRHGGLYKQVLNDINNEDKKIAHVGDNEISDIRSAREFDIHAEYYKSCHEVGNPYRAEGLSELVGSAYRGIVNTTMHNGLNDYTPYYKYGFIYGGLYVLGFCNWIHKKAKQENIDKILFLSRDGEIYKKVFDLMYDDIANEYVYWSRIVNTNCTRDINKETFLTTMVEHKALSVIPVTISSLLEMLCLNNLEIELSRYNLSGDMLLTKENQKIVENFFIDHWDILLQQSEKNADKFKKIFENIIEDKKKVAIIDVGWNGSGPLGLKHLIENKWKIDCEVKCWLAGSRSGNNISNMNEILNEDISPYIFSRMYNRNLYDTHSISNNGTNCIYFELFTQAMCPSFEGVDNEGNFTFDIPEVENYEMIRDIHAGIYDFSKRYKDIFKNDTYMYNISGYDAYIPFRHVIKDLDYIKEFFLDFKFARGIGGDKKNQNIESIGQIMEKCKLL
ncbi:HAD family hydrolase [Clostridium sp. CH2]|uniref:HAD family hydrolase n=1 Tax=Clostridium sp. CH2 TaxID=2949990 RepID=UPI00207A0EAE|nr:HAD family hydrolase [Clostridium sp. CH2]